ncbi:MAG: rhomboid family intramembrane serine protease [Vicinamibacterales bacterium]
MLVYRAMTAAERARFARTTVQVIRQGKDAITLWHRELESFRDTLHARTPLAPMTPTLIGVNVAVFVLMLWGASPLSDPETLVEWGGNFGPRTANGEWWRLITSLFVHASWLHLLANVVGFVHLGLILERLVGPVAFAVMYVAVGIFSSLMNLSASPMAVHVGASGAIFGAYGLMIAVLMWGVLRRSAPIMPIAAAKRVAPATLVFVLYNLASDASTGVAEFSALIAGFACGLVMAGSVSEPKASVRRIAMAAAAMLAAAVAVAVPVRGIGEVVDATPELQRVVTEEEHTATTFRAAADQFNTGRITAEALAEVIERGILPTVRATRERVDLLQKVYPQQETLVAACKEYLRLRDESWRVRTAAFRQTRMSMLREADTIERASLEILGQITAALHAQDQTVNNVVAGDRE